MRVNDWLVAVAVVRSAVANRVDFHEAATQYESSILVIGHSISEAFNDTAVTALETRQDRLLMSFSIP